MSTISTNYTDTQIQQYFERIKLTTSSTTPDLYFLTKVLHYQLISIPFESLALHYSSTCNISIDPQDAFEKLVTNRRGGYCLENNTFFAHILRSLGFYVTHVVCRISNSSRGINDGGWRGMSHMANIVTIDGFRYLVDVGFGADGPCRPVPLTGEAVSGARHQRLSCEQRTLPQHGDNMQKVWVYGINRASGWTDIYHFMDVEMFHADFEILNYYNMRMSAFARMIVVQRFIQEDGEISGSWLLVKEVLKRKTVGEITERVLDTEQERLDVLEKYFDIVLTQDQIVGIAGKPGELGS